MVLIYIRHINFVNFGYVVFIYSSSSRKNYLACLPYERRSRESVGTFTYKISYKSVCNVKTIFLLNVYESILTKSNFKFFLIFVTTTPTLTGLHWQIAEFKRSNLGNFYFSKRKKDNTVCNIPHRQAEAAAS